MARPYRTPTDERDVFRALAHPMRRRIVVASLDEQCSFDQLRDLIRRSDATLAGHLRILREARVLTATRNGRSVFYRADRKALRSASKWLSSLAKKPASS